MTGPAIPSVPAVVQLSPARSGSDAFIALSRADNGLTFMRWNGTTMLDVQTLSSVIPGSALDQCFALASRRRSLVANWAEVEPTP